MKIKEDFVSHPSISEEVIDVTIHTDKRVIIIPFPKNLIYKEEIESTLDDLYTSHTFEISGEYKNPSCKRIQINI